MIPALVGIRLRRGSFGSGNGIDDHRTGRRLRGIGRPIGEQLGAAILRQLHGKSVRAEADKAEDHGQHDQQCLRLERKTDVHSHLSLPAFPLGSVGGEATDEPISRPRI